MKRVIALIIFAMCIVGIARAHPQYTMTPNVVSSHIRGHAWWSWINEKQKLALCVGTDIHNKPVCIMVPKEYVVIELINPPLK